MWVNIGCKPHAKVTRQVLWDDTLDLGYGKLIMSDTFLTLSNAIMVILGLDDKFLYQNLGHILKHFTSRSKWPKIIICKETIHSIESFNNLDYIIKKGENGFRAHWM
jgi:hypothetical protein